MDEFDVTPASLLEIQMNPAVGQAILFETS
jgi:hypothetical protein